MRGSLPFATITFVSLAMADLTILSPAPLPSFHFAIRPPTEDFRKRLDAKDQVLQVSPAIPFTVTEVTFDDDDPASQTATRPELRHDPFLLSPPKSRPRRSRRASAVVQGRSSSAPPAIAEEDENQTEEEEPAYSYTRSFRPFTYPSSPSLLGFEDRSSTDLRRPAPPLCEYNSSFASVCLLKPLKFDLKHFGGTLVVQRSLGLHIRRHPISSGGRHSLLQDSPLTVRTQIYPHLGLNCG